MDVLLATGQFDLRLAIELLLREEPGVNVVGTASEAAGLLALIGTAQPDLVAFDWTLPGRPSMAILADLLAVAHRPRLLVIAETPETAQIALAAGADAVTVKGDPPRHFLTTFRKLRSR